MENHKKHLKYMADQYILDVESRRVGARIGVNGVPLAVDNIGEGQRMVRGINEWILPKYLDKDKEVQPNELTMHLFWPPGKDYHPGEAFARASVYIAAEGSTSPQPRIMLAELNWPALGGLEAYPYTGRLPFSIYDAPPTRLWAEAQQIEELTNNDREQIWQVVENFRSVLAPMQSREAAYDITAYKFEDQARADGLELKRLRAMALIQYGVFRQFASPVTNELSFEQLNFQIMADRKVVLVTDGPENEVFVLYEEAKPEIKYAIDVYVSRIAGEWRIVR
jgi:hypothetical protein